VRSLLFFAALLGVASGNSIAQEALNRLIFTGDVMLSRAVRRQILEARDPALPFRKMAPMLAASDIAFVNLESPFSDQGPYREGGLIFHASPDTIAGLKLAGIAIASTANNHSRDCASHGVEFTIAWLRKHGVEPVGSGESAEAAHRGIVLVRHGIRTRDLSWMRRLDRLLRITITTESQMALVLTALRKVIGQTAIETRLTQVVE